MENIKCPNCAGEMTIDENGQKYICMYCDSEIMVNHSSPSQAVDYTSIALEVLKRNGTDNKIVSIKEIREMTGLGLQEAKRLLECSIEGKAYSPISIPEDTDEETVSQTLLQIYADISAPESVAETWTSLCNALDAAYTTEQYLVCFKQIANDRFDCATCTLHSDLFKKAYDRLSAQLEAGEDILLWKDDGAFIQNAKEGFAITDRSLFFVNKKSIAKVAMKEITMIKKAFFVNSWYINAISDYSLNTIGCSNSQLGIMMAYIFKTAREFNTEDYKIEVFGK